MDDERSRDEPEQPADETAGQDTEGHLFRAKYREEGEPEASGRDTESDDPDVEGHRFYG